jgi:hypothetical protein
MDVGAILANFPWYLLLAVSQLVALNSYNYLALCHLILKWNDNTDKRVRLFEDEWVVLTGFDHGLRQEMGGCY